MKTDLSGIAPPAPVIAQTAVAPRRDDPVRGILLMVTSGILYSSSDAISKHLGATLPSVEIAWLRWIGFLLIFAPVILGSRFRVLRSRAPGIQIIRSLCLAGSSLLFIMGLRYLPMADAITINFVSPIVVTALSIVFLSEKVGIRRWAAVFVGLIGVVVVIRPGSGHFGATALLPAASATCWALAIVTTRKLAGVDGPWTALSFMSVVGVVLLSALVPFEFVTPTWEELGFVALMTAAAGIAQFLTIAASAGRKPRCWRPSAMSSSSGRPPTAISSSATCLISGPASERRSSSAAASTPRIASG